MSEESGGGGGQVVYDETGQSYYVPADQGDRNEQGNSYYDDSGARAQAQARETQENARQNAAPPPPLPPLPTMQSPDDYLHSFNAQFIPPPSNGPSLDELGQSYFPSSTQSDQPKWITDVNAFLQDEGPYSGGDYGALSHNYNVNWGALVHPVNNIAGPQVPNYITRNYTAPQYGAGASSGQAGNDYLSTYSYDQAGNPVGTTAGGNTKDYTDSQVADRDQALGAQQRRLLTARDPMYPDYANFVSRNPNSTMEDYQRHLQSVAANAAGNYHPTADTTAADAAKATADKKAADAKAAADAAYQAYLQSLAAYNGGGGSGATRSALQQAMTDYEAAQVALAKSKQAADQLAQQGNELQTWTKDVLDYASQHPYGARFLSQGYMPLWGGNTLQKVPFSQNLQDYWANNPSFAPQSVSGVGPSPFVSGFNSAPLVPAATTGADQAASTANTAATDNTASKATASKAAQFGQLPPWGDATIPAGAVTPDQGMWPLMQSNGANMVVPSAQYWKSASPQTQTNAQDWASSVLGQDYNSDYFQHMLNESDRTNLAQPDTFK